MSRSATAAAVVVARTAWIPNDRFLVGALTEFVYDTFNTAYAEADWTLPALFHGLEMKASLQLIDQRSVGAELLADSTFDTQRVGA